MKINDHLLTSLKLGTSLISDAGIGVFATDPIMGGIPICEYKGDLLSEEQLVERYKTETSPLLPEYALRHPNARASNVPEDSNSNVWVDSNPSIVKAEIGLGAYINDKHNHKERAKRPDVSTQHQLRNLERLKLNKEFLLKNGYNALVYPLPQNPYFMILSLRDIENGEEIYIDYGDSFWESWAKRNLVQEIASPAEPNSPVIVKSPRLSAEKTAQ